jgi:hypothetical protein
MSELVGQEAATLQGAGPILALVEGDVGASGECAGPNAPCGRGSLVVTVNPDGAEVVTEATLHLRQGVVIEPVARAELGREPIGQRSG